jgi:hypothetical protein
MILLSLVLGGSTPTQAAWWPGFDGPAQLTDWVLALTWYGGQLVAGGDFVVTGEDTVLHSVGTWDGSRWQPLGGGIQGGGCGPPCWARVTTLANYGDLLLAAGNFVRAGRQQANNIAAWDGSRWRPLLSGTNGWVFDIEVIGSDAYVGGQFSTAGGLVVDNIARWDGHQWHWVGQGLCCGWVQDLIEFEGELIAAGNFTVSGVHTGIAAWDGVAWRPLGDARPSATALAVFNGMLVANGVFYDGATNYNFATWDGTSWSPLGTFEQSCGYSQAFAVFRGLLVSGGEVCGSSARLDAWDGQQWTPFHSGVDDRVQCLFAMDSTLYVGGRFTHAGGIPSKFVARWDDPPTPILVQDLHAAPSDLGMIGISWRVAEAGGIQGIQVQRSVESEGPFVAISPLLPPEHDMSFTDAPGFEAATLWYRLAAHAWNGTVEYIGPVLAEPRAATTGHALFPIADTAAGPIDIRFVAGATSEPFRLVVYNVTGRLVRVLHEGHVYPGPQVASWNRIADSGRPVSRGVYFVNLSAGGFQITRKLVLRYGR